MGKYILTKSSVKKGTSVKSVGPGYEYPPGPDAATERTGYRRSNSIRRSCNALLISGEIRVLEEP